ncbi:MAG: hypothetical protein HZA90_26800 [Verrucomicrobia bacterium]|nr:hypothetical protein [Verrucomicrobiota bacterium]
MKRSTKTMTFLACCLCALEITAAPAQTNSAPSATTADLYQMDLNLDPAFGRMEGRMLLRYGNNSKNPLPAVRLRLDPNLDTKQSLEILAVQDSAGRPLRWKHQPLKFAKWSSEKGALEVVLPEPVLPAGQATFAIRFRGEGSYVSSNMIVLQDDPYHSLDGWYPKAMTPRGDGWSIDDDRPSDYEVTVKLPAGIAVASTGRRVSEVKRDGQVELRLKAERVWGFTIYGSSRWQRHERRAGGVDLGICVPAEAESWVERLLDATADSIAFYEKEYAPFPARHLDIIGQGSFSERAHGSSAACNLITIFLGGQFEKQYRFLVAHEVAHQYFGTQVGFHRADIHWIPVGLGMTMDEHYAQARGLDATFGRKIMREFYFMAERMGFDTTLSQPVEPAMQAPPPWSFGWNMSLAHGKAYAVCAMLRDLLGAEKFQAVLRELITQRAGGLIRQADLIAACETALGERLDWFVADWIDGRATFDNAITSVAKVGGDWDVTVAQVGTGRFPAQVEVTTVSGEKLRQRVDRAKPSDTLHFKTPGPLRSVRLDPEHIYPDLNETNNVWRAGQ